jgi:LysR family transcriptional regulator, hca operon transcriptional activator
VVDCEPLIVLMPSDHRLASREAIHPREFVGEIFIGGSEKATVLGAVTQDYLRRSGLNSPHRYRQDISRNFRHSPFALDK